MCSTSNVLNSPNALLYLGFSFLVLLGCHDKIPSTSTSHGSGGWKVQDQGVGGFSVCWGPLHGLQMAVFLPCPLMEEGTRDLLGVSFIRALSSFMRAPALGHGHLPKAPTEPPRCPQSSQFLKQLSLCFQERPWLLAQTLGVTEQTPTNQICWACTLSQVPCRSLPARSVCWRRETNTKSPRELNRLAEYDFLSLRLGPKGFFGGGCFFFPCKGGSSTCLWLYLFLSGSHVWVGGVDGKHLGSRHEPSTHQ